MTSATEPIVRPGPPAAPEPRADVLPLAAGLPVLALFGWWATADGGAAPGAWYPGALALVCALAVLSAVFGRTSLGPAGRLSARALAGFAAWSLASIAWADARGDAWDEANRALLYLVVFALFAGLPWRAREATRLVGAFVLVTAAIGLWALAEAIAGDGQAFREGRLAGPIGYENASAALFLAAFWPALVLAADRRRSAFCSRPPASCSNSPCLRRAADRCWPPRSGSSRRSCWRPSGAACCSRSPSRGV